MRNDTQETFQLRLDFGPDCLTGTLRANRETGVEYRVGNRDLRYCRGQGGIYQEVDVLQRMISQATGELLGERFLYRNRCRIGYPLPAGTVVLE